VFEGLTDLTLLLQQAPINNKITDKSLSLFQMQSCK